ncbi:MAG: HEAT repeat domain-containing protein [Candidatus Riflebacteria bacterium]|nr:HEAT repeat domain-containing protein [Candidatus Riflebacteria bacterium]
MPLDEQQVRSLTSNLRSDSESERLKACDTIAKLPAGDRDSVKSAVAALSEIFLNDANPAVKFMAKKALQNLGESPDKIRQAAEAAKGGAAVAATSQEQDRAAIARDLPVVWKCAQEEIRPCVSLFPKLIWLDDIRLRNQCSVALEKCGHLLAAFPLLLAFEEEKKTPMWEAQEAETGDAHSDVRDVIDLMRVQASGINPALAAQMGNLQRPEVLAAFIDMLRSSNDVLRDNAVRILAELKDARTIDPLLRLLGAGQPDLDSKVITTLSKVARADKDLQIQILKKILSHFKPGEAEDKLLCIVEAVGRIANPKTFDFVKGCLRHPMVRVRANAVEALQNFEVGSDERVRLLIPLLKDDNNRVLGNAIVALWGTAVQSFVQAQVENMMNSSDKWVRVSLASSMGVVNAPGGVPYLIKLLTDPEPEVRKEAIQAVRKISNREALMALAKQVEHPDANVRIYAIETAGRHGFSDMAPAITQVAEVSEQDPKLLSTAILALGRLRAVTAVAIITKHLKHQEERVKANAVEALEALNEPKIVPLIQTSVRDPNPRTRANAVKALWKYGDIWVVENVKAMLESHDVNMQASGAYALGEMADMARSPARLIALPLLMMALRRHPKFNDFKQLLG